MFFSSFKCRCFCDFGRHTGFNTFLTRHLEGEHAGDIYAVAGGSIGFVFALSGYPTLNTARWVPLSRADIIRYKPMGFNFAAGSHFSVSVRGFDGGTILTLRSVVNLRLERYVTFLGVAVVP